jgi:hypothetical protein
MRKHLFLNLILACIFLPFVAQSSLASRITMNTTVNAIVENGKLEISIATTNKGDESAFSTQAEVKVLGKTILLEKLNELIVDGTYQAKASIPLTGIIPGEYPVVTTIHYADANQYPFSAINCQKFSYKTQGQPAILFGTLRRVTLWEEGDTTLALKNLDANPIDFSLRVAAPNELTIVDLPAKNNIKAKSGIDLPIKIKKFSALSGSSYQIFGIVEFTKDGIHQTSIIPGMAEVLENKTILGIDQKFIYLILAVLILAFIGSQFKK